MAANAISGADVGFDEDRGGPRDKNNYLSFPVGGLVFKSTKTIFPWVEAGPHEAPGTRMLIAGCYIEKIFKKAKVAVSDELKKLNWLTRCLSAKFLTHAVEVVIVEGLFNKPDGTVIAYKDIDYLYEAADVIVMKNEDDEFLLIDEDSFEWLEGWGNNPQDGSIKWIADLTIYDLVSGPGTLENYVELTYAAGPRSTEQVRIEEGSNFHTLFRSDGHGGLFIQCLKKYYYPDTQVGAPLHPAFLAQRVVPFIIDTKWPKVYDLTPPNEMEASYDLLGRAAWSRANKQERAALVKARLGRAIRKSLPTLELVMRDHLGDPNKLQAGVQRVGDLALDGKEGTDDVFGKIDQVESKLAEEYLGLVTSERGEDVHTDDIIQKLCERMRPSRGTGGGDKDDAEARAPKPAQLARALAQEGYTAVEVKHFLDLQRNRPSNDRKLIILRDALTAHCVLFHAVLMAAANVRLSTYIGPNGSDFLALLYHERHLLSLYFGQTLAFDEELGEVPKELRTFRLEETQLKVLCDFEWEKLDPLNHFILRLRGREVGTTFQTYSTKNFYHDADMLRHMIDLFGKLFDALGFAAVVPSDNGLTIRSFFTRILKVQKFALALSPEEQQNAFAFIDDLVGRAWKAAAASAKRTIYGPSPADRHLHAFLGAEEDVVIELHDTLNAIHNTAEWRRNTSGIFTPKVKAATLAGFTPSGGGGGGGGSGAGKGAATHSAPGPKSPQKKQKTKASSSTPQGGGKGTRAGTQPTPKGPSNGQAASAQGRKGGIDHAFLEKKGLFPYDDGSYSVGTVHVDWPNICKLKGWDMAKYCGPRVMAMGSDPDRYCCYGCPKHAPQPMVDGKPFDAAEHRDQLNALGLTGVKKELQEDRKAKRKPPGVPKKVGAALVYPARHFA